MKKLRDEADIIVTNPPFSLFREFLAWLVDGGKNFLIIGNMNALKYKEAFPLIRKNQMWLGASIHSGDRGRFVTGKFAVVDGNGMQQNFDGLDRSRRCGSASRRSMRTIS